MGMDTTNYAETTTATANAITTNSGGSGGTGDGSPRRTSLFEQDILSPLVLDKKVVEQFHGGEGDRYCRHCGGVARRPRHAQEEQEEEECCWVMVTGATGLVGVHVVQTLLQEQPFSTCRVMCLVRAKSDQEAQERFRGALEEFRLQKLMEDNDWTQRVRVCAGDISQVSSEGLFGWSEETTRYWAERVHTVIHCAAYVNWILPYEKLRSSNVLAVRHVLDFATRARAKPVLYLSSISTLTRRDGKEEPPQDHPTLRRNGYVATKWVAERLFWRAWKEYGLPVCVLRLGMVSGSTATGVNVPTQFPGRLLKGCLELAMCSPSTTPCHIWTPVDFCAKAIVRCALRMHTLTEDPESPVQQGEGRFLHIQTPHMFSYHDLALALRHVSPQVQDASSHRAWFEALCKQPANPLFPLYPWVRNDPQGKLVDTTYTTAVLSRLRLEWPNCDASLFNLYARHVQQHQEQQ